MAEDLPAASDLARRLFAAERNRAEADAERAARLLARIGATVAAGAVVGGAATGAASSGLASKAAAAGLTVKAAPWIALAFVAGSGTGAFLQAKTSEAPRGAPTVPSTAPPSTPSTDAMVPAPSAAAPAASPAPSATSTAPLAVRSPGPSSSTPTGVTSASPPAPASVSAPPPIASDADLASERALVDRARTAMTRGDAAAALVALDAHAARFPGGRLAEEREALAIQALARAGRAGEAATRAAAFRRAHPNSIFAPAVDLAVP